MLLYFLYWLLSPLLWLILPVISIFQPKIRKHWLKEKSTWKKAGARLANGQAGKQVVVFHAASAGEFEQLKPILKRVDRNRFFIIQSFFSPTIYEKESETQLADAVVYHPFDFPWLARAFFQLLNINYYITTRHDLWPHHLRIAQKLGINARDFTRTKEAVFKELNLQPHLDDECFMFQKMSENPKLIERPIVVKGERAVLGRPPEKVEDLLNA